MRVEVEHAHAFSIPTKNIHIVSVVSCRVVIVVVVVLLRPRFACLFVSYRLDRASHRPAWASVSHIVFGRS